MGTGRLLELTEAAGTLTITFVEALLKSMVFQELGGQLLSSGTSVEANYRAARRARSSAEFIAKLKIVEEEADESMPSLQFVVRVRRALFVAGSSPFVARCSEFVAVAVAAKEKG